MSIRGLAVLIASGVVAMGATFFTTQAPDPPVPEGGSIWVYALE
jgi:hypothetical protein